MSEHTVNLQSLRVFVRVCELGSFTKASISLGIAQPSVSRVIKELEMIWGGPMFYRTGRGVALSELGSVLLPRAQALLDHAEKLASEIGGEDQIPSGTVRLALQPSLVGTLVPRLFESIRSDYPKIVFKIYDGYSDQIENWLAEGEVDIGIFSKYKPIRQDRDTVLMTTKMILAGPVDRFSLPSCLDFSSLSEYPLVVPIQPNGLRLAVDAVAKAMGMSLNIVAETDSVAAQKALAAQCNCYTILARHSLLDDARAFSTSVIQNPCIKRRVVLVTSQQNPLTLAGREVTRRIVGIFKSLEGENDKKSRRRNG